MKYVIIFIFYLVISGIVAGIAIRNHDGDKEELDDMTGFEKTVVVIAAFPLWVVIAFMGVPMMIVYLWMHEEHKND